MINSYIHGESMKAPKTSRLATLSIKDKRLSEILVKKTESTKLRELRQERKSGHHVEMEKNELV
jgi:hypothetical protein